MSKNAIADIDGVGLRLPASSVPDIRPVLQADERFAWAVLAKEAPPVHFNWSDGVVTDLVNKPAEGAMGTSAFSSSSVPRLGGRPRVLPFSDFRRPVQVRPGIDICDHQRDPADRRARMHLAVGARSGSKCLGWGGFLCSKHAWQRKLQSGGR